MIVLADLFDVIAALWPELKVDSVAILAGHILHCVLSVLRFEQGQWVQIKVHIDEAPEAERPPP